MSKIESAQGIEPTRLEKTTCPHSIRSPSESLDTLFPNL